MCQFSVKTKNFEFFGLNLGKLHNYMRYFGSNNVEGVAESWVEAKMAWVEVYGAGWSWVHGISIPTFIYIFGNKTISVTILNLLPSLATSLILSIPYA